jgi:hypothetical protein
MSNLEATIKRFMLLLRAFVWDKQALIRFQNIHISFGVIKGLKQGKVDTVQLNYGSS